MCYFKSVGAQENFDRNVVYLYDREKHILKKDWEQVTCVNVATPTELDGGPG